MNEKKQRTKLTTPSSRNKKNKNKTKPGPIRSQASPYDVQPIDQMIGFLSPDAEKTTTNVEIDGTPPHPALGKTAVENDDRKWDPSGDHNPTTTTDSANNSNTTEIIEFHQPSPDDEEEDEETTILGDDSSDTTMVDQDASF